MKKLQPVPIRAKRQIRKLERELDAMMDIRDKVRSDRNMAERERDEMGRDYMYLRTVIVNIVAVAAGLSVSEARERVEHMIRNAESTPADVAAIFAVRKAGSSGNYIAHTVYAREFPR